MKSRIVVAIMTLVLGLVGSFSMSIPANAEGVGATIGVSPMRESVVLNPGDTYKGSFTVNNPGYSETKINYYTEIKPFYVNEEYVPIYINEDGNSNITEWIKITSGEKGSLEPNAMATVEFQIDVPDDAPAGGQYAAIIVSMDLEKEEGGGGNVGVSEGVGVSHIILAEITGNSITAGDILDIGVNSFLFGGSITAYSTVENTGNIHGLATYTMKVYPLFSDQPVYTNEENIEDHYVLPGRKFYNESYWENTPSIGIFNVSYTVEFQGIKSEVTRMVVVCPWWALLIIFFGIVLLTLRIITLVKVQKSRKPIDLQ